MVSVRLFISAVSDEFGEYRDQLRKDLTRTDVEVKVQDDFKDYGASTLEKLDTYIAACDAVIHLVGAMNGAIPPMASVQAIVSRHPDLAQKVSPLQEILERQEPLSYTQWEAWLAIYHGKPLIIAKAAEGAIRGPEYAPNDSGSETQVQHLRRLRAIDRYPGITFTGVDNLSKFVLSGIILDLLVRSTLDKRELPSLLGAASTALKFSGKIREFLEEYLVSPEGEGTVPFGGREYELEHLDQWLTAENGPSRCMIIAPAGRGKSALVVQWMKRLELAHAIFGTPARWHLAFVPISMRFGTNRPVIYYEALAARLAEILGQHLTTGGSDPEEYYEEKCRIFLDEINVKAIRVAIIIDGIDESLGRSFHANWFPRNAGPNLRLLISGRLLLGDTDFRGWMDRLDWRGIRVRACQTRATNIARRRGVICNGPGPCGCFDHASRRAAAPLGPHGWRTTLIEILR